MKRQHCRAMAILLCLPCLFLFSLAAHATESGESLLLESGIVQSLDGISPYTAILRQSSSYDPLALGSFVTGVKPWLDLLDTSSYSLKLSLPVIWGPDFYGWHQEGSSFFSAGLLASIRLNSLPPRFGLWTLSTGLFLIKRDQNFLDRTAFSDSDFTGGVGTLNIRIVY